MSGCPDDLVADAEALGAEAAAWLCADLDDVELGDFADVVRRAARSPEGSYTEQDVEQARALASVDDATHAAAIHFGTLEDFLDDAAAFVAEQPVDDIPPMPAPHVEPASTRTPVGRIVALAVGVLAAAAAVLLVVWPQAEGSILDRGGGLREGDFSALDRAEAEDTAGSAEQRRPAPRATTPRSDDAPLPVPDEEVGDDEEPPQEAPPPALDSASARPRGNGPSKADRLEALDAEARAAWKVGDLGTARDKLEALVRLGGRRTIADIAYGDLFSLARQRGDDAALRQYWRRYAAKFPRGRYIDDARAGLCRTAPASERRGCWQSYLDERPHGTYREHARDVLSRAE